jgi:hypothetical protein
MCHNRLSLHKKCMDLETCINKIYDIIDLVQRGLLSPKKVTSAIADVLEEYKFGKTEKSPLEEILVDEDELIQLYLNNVSVSDFRRHISDIKGYRIIKIGCN